MTSILRPRLPSCHQGATTLKRARCLLVASRTSSVLVVGRRNFSPTKPPKLFFGQRFDFYIHSVDSIFNLFEFSCVNINRNVCRVFLFIPIGFTLVGCFVPSRKKEEFTWPWLVTRHYSSWWSPFQVSLSLFRFIWFVKHEMMAAFLAALLFNNISFTYEGRQNGEKNPTIPFSDGWASLITKLSIGIVLNRSRVTWLVSQIRDKS